MSFYPAQLQSFSLSGSGAVAGATSITLKYFTDIDGNPLTMADFGAVGFGTLEPGNNALEEQISFTGITQNASGTATLTGVSSVGFLTPYTATSGLSKTHAGSTSFVVSNTSGFYDEYPAKQNDEVLTGFWQAPNPIAPQGIATRQFVLNAVSGTAAFSTNAVAVSGTAGETIAAGNIVYLNTDNKWYKASSAAAATTNLLQLGVAQGAGTLNNTITNGIVIKGVSGNFAGLTAGSAYYLSTAGGISLTPGTVERAVATAVSTTSILFDPDFFYIPTGNQKGAFAGTSGTPSSVNPYATKATTDLKAGLKFGGTGADGALNVTSGTTTIDLGGAQVVTKNYTSISVTGTGTLAFSNPHANGTTIILKSQGAVAITSSGFAVDVRSLGGAAGNGNGTNQGAAFQCRGGGGGASSVASGTDGGTTIQGTALAGTNGNDGYGAGRAEKGYGGASTTDANLTPNKAGSGYGGIHQFASGIIAAKFLPLTPGAGGGGGGNGPNGTGIAGTGGRGAGALYIECGGALNFTGTINASGIDGTSTGGNNSGGGGGGGGTVIILYNSLTANSGTINVAGGTGGTSSGNAGGNGGAGYSLVASNTEFA